MSNKLAVLGAGSMGSAIAEAVITNKLLRSEDVLLYNKTQGNLENLFEYPYILIAVKPQDFKTLAFEVKDLLSKEAVLISIMAGVSVNTIFTHLNNTKIIRAMPNLGMQVNRGVTGIYQSNTISQDDLNFVKQIFSSAGICFLVDDEKMLDVITAVSGSGPGYVYYFMEAMSEAAIKMGLDASQVASIVQQTFQGALDFAKHKGASFQELRSLVTSKKGTTHAAMEVFNQANLKGIISEALQAACKRAEDLGKD